MSNSYQRGVELAKAALTVTIEDPIDPMPCGCDWKALGHNVKGSVGPVCPKGKRRRGRRDH